MTDEETDLQQIYLYSFGNVKVVGREELLMTFKRTNLEMVFAGKKTENFDDAYNTTGNLLLDILFMTEYYQKNLYETPHIGESDKAKLFAMFIRDPRHGLGRRDLGKHLMHMTNLGNEEIVQVGRFDDLLMFFKGEYRDETVIRDVAFFLINEAKKGNHLAKKWLPRLNNKDGDVAREICKLTGLSQKDYRRIIKNEETVEYKLSYHEHTSVDLFANGTYYSTLEELKHPLLEGIDYETVPSLAMIKYFQKFLRDDSERFEDYLESVKSGEKKLNVAVTNVYDVYRNREKIDADMFYSKLPKVEINAIPILDTSGSMHDEQDSIGKAMAIAHHIAKGSTYAKDFVVSFSSQPKLMKVDKNRPPKNLEGLARDIISEDGSDYSKELASIYTGDMSNTDFGAVMEILAELSDFPEYLVVLSDMEFDYGSKQSKDTTMKIFKDAGAETKIVWWNFNSRSTTVPETDEYGNIFISGYSPEMLNFLEVGFDGEKFLDKLLEEYSKKSQ